MDKGIVTVFSKQDQKVKLHCTLFEDNNGALELTTMPWYIDHERSTSKLSIIILEKVQKGMMAILPIDTNDQIADQFTKAHL